MKRGRLLEFIGSGEAHVRDDLDVLLAHMQTACKRIVALIALSMRLERAVEMGGVSVRIRVVIPKTTRYNLCMNHFFKLFIYETKLIDVIRSKSINLKMTLSTC